tara:strand:- start:40 stop:1368 length:1329 start_codon:yes stop_codon:yes gene_type:complete
VSDFLNILNNLRPGYKKGGQVSIENQDSNLEKQKITRAKFQRAKELLTNGNSRAETMRIITKEFNLKRHKYAGTTKWLRAAANAVKEKGIEIKSGVQKKRDGGYKTRAGITRTNLTKKRSSVIEKDKKFTGKSGYHQHHAAFKDTNANLNNMMPIKARLNIKMQGFENKILKARDKFLEIYNNPKKSQKLKEAALIEHHKTVRKLRLDNPEYADKKSRLSFRKSAFKPGFVIKEKLPLGVISPTESFQLKGETPKSPRGKIIIEKAEESMNKILKGNKLSSFPAQLAELKIPKAGPLTRRGIRSIAAIGAQSGIKALGVAALPIEAYFMNEARKEGKSFAEIAAMPFLLEGKMAEYQDMMNMSPVERQAVNRENIEQDESLLDTDFYTPRLEGVEAINISEVKDRVATKRKFEEAQRRTKIANKQKTRFTLPNSTGIVDDEV